MSERDSTILRAALCIAGAAVWLSLVAVSWGAPRPRAGSSALPSAPQTRIPVNLFGQPCILQGPLGEEALKQIHAVSPDQVDTGCRDFPLEPRVKDSLGRLAQKGVPASLDPYREKVRVRLDRLASLAKAADEAKRAHSPAPLVKLAEANEKASPGSSKAFLPAAKKLLSADVARIREDAKLDQKLVDAYCEGLGSDPEEEFHRVIQKLGVQYLCSFDARETMEEGEGD